MESTTQEVPREEWNLFFDGFSHQHTGWTVTMEVLSPDVGAQIEVEELAFEGISVASAHDGDAIAVMFRKEPDKHATHTIVARTHVRLDQSGIERGVGETLQIESADGDTVLIRFGPAV